MPVLNTEEARALLDAIDGASLLGLRDRALIGVMVYSFARMQMKVGDYFIQGRRGWMRLHEKYGKEHEVPCHHNLESFSMSTSPPPALPRMRPGRCSGRLPAAQAT